MTAPTILSRARLVAIMTPSLLLGGALVSQYIGGLYPCEMCMWQRWPHLVAIFFALDAIALRTRPPLSALFAGLAAFAIAVSGAIGAFHAGVEYGWWEGLTACSVIDRARYARQHHGRAAHPVRCRAMVAVRHFPRRI